jgi:hypothetical protein
VKLVVNGAEVGAERIGLQLSPTSNFIEWLPLDKLTAVELVPHAVNPSLRVIDEGGRYRIYPLNPWSLLHVAAEPCSTFAVRELRAVAVRS